MSLDKGLTPKEVAEKFYGAIVAGDVETFKDTVKEFYRVQMERARGASPEFWWESGRRYAEEYGVTWTFHGVREENKTEVVLWFKRLNADGSQRGSLVPIHLIPDPDDDGEWRVETATV
jgi:hypothetical protein